MLADLFKLPPSRGATAETTAKRSLRDLAGLGAVSQTHAVILLDGGTHPQDHPVKSSAFDAVAIPP